jgi:hypothetical protein
MVLLSFPNTTDSLNPFSNQDAPVLIVRKEDGFVSTFLSKLAAAAVPVRGAGVPFTADLLPGSPAERFKALAGESLRLAYCRSVSGSQLPLRVGRLEGASMSSGPSFLSKEELSKSLPKKKQFSYVNTPARHAAEHEQSSSSSSSASPAGAVAPAVPTNTIESAFDLSKCECLNDKKEHSWKNAFESLRPAAASESYLESDVDAQVLISFQFKVPVRLSSLSIHTSASHAKSGPSKVLLFANRTNIGFDSVESLKADQSISFTEEQLLKSSSVALAATKFSSVHSLSVRVVPIYFLFFTCPNSCF